MLRVQVASTNMENAKYTSCFEQPTPNAKIFSFYYKRLRSAGND